MQFKKKLKYHQRVETVFEFPFQQALMVVDLYVLVLGETRDLSRVCLFPVTAGQHL